MTLLQAMERTDWSLRLTGVHTRMGTGTRGDIPHPCEVCDNEMCHLTFAAVEDEFGLGYYIDVGEACARDLRKALERDRRTRR